MRGAKDGENRVMPSTRTTAAAARWRMPTVFGPAPGPRGGADGRPFDYRQAPRATATVSFLTERDALARYLPPGFELLGEPVVTVEWTALRQLPWLAGRGYHMLGVKYPARFSGRHDTAEGPFLAVLWENHADPILTGREELGFAKVYCELPAPRESDGGAKDFTAEWDGHVFCRLSLARLQDAPRPGPVPPKANTGTLHHRYLPRVGAPGESEVAQATLTPSGGFTQHVDRYQTGEGRVAFLPSTWEQLPTLHHIVNALAALPQLEPRGATWCESRGAKDLSDQRVLS